MLKHTLNIIIFILYIRGDKLDNYEFIDIAKRIANTIPTRYELGGWGQQDNGVYLFDCVCFIKSILWGFNFSKGGHGGAIYLANGVPDVGANRMIELCTNISYDFNNIEIGEILWLDGHVGIYIGNRCVAEATSAWENKVLISNVLNDGVRIKNNHQVYRWIKHGKLPYIKYNSAYVKITDFTITDIKTTSIKIDYKTDLPISNALYTFDGINYLKIPDNGIITNLKPNTNYNIKIKLERKYTSNYTESKTVSFKTQDEPIYTKYNIGNIITLNGKVYIDPYSKESLMELKNYIGEVTNINNHYGTKNPYQINDIGWVKEDDIKLYEPSNIIDKIKNIFKKILYLMIPIIIFLILFILI